MELSKCHVIWRHSVSTWRHEDTELTIHILACRCARKMILSLFLWYFESSSSKMLLISHLYDVVTSWRHVMTSQNLIYLSQLVDVLESWFFFCFHGFFRSLSSKMLLIFNLCDAVTSWRHVMTSLNLINLYQLLDVLESWFFFCFHVFLGHWVQKCYWFFTCVMPWGHDVMSWRPVMTSLNLIHLSHLVDVPESWFFFVSMVFWIIEFKNVINFSFVWCCDVMTSCHDVTKPDLLISACRCARKLILFLFPWFFYVTEFKNVIDF